MIILPDRNIPRAKFLMPVHKRHWITPSASQFKSVFGHENGKYNFIIKAKRKNKIVWQGTFEDREDFDIFLHSIATGNIKYDKFVQSLPTPIWDPSLLTDVVYEFVTTITLTSSNTSPLNRPVDWNNSSNYIWCWGGGGGGSRGNNTGVAGRGGGGGGGFSYAQNITFNNPTIPFSHGTAGPGATTLNTAGTAGGDAWIGDGASSIANCAVGAKGGGAANTQAGSAGGQAASGVGNFAKSSGGTGGSGQATNGAGGGGGGAAGYGGDGGNGTNGASGNGGDGGVGGNGGGAGATANGGTGGNGTLNPPTGGGGGGGGSGTPGNGGPGGSYGAGGGGGGTASGGSASGGSGQQGAIYILYEPFNHVWTNMPMLGM